jgi:predicted 3-demethylubiquinone-9 3-methyltransferase (glyoxalase superfamily)
MSRFQKITPCLWFDTAAEPAALYYTSVFKNSRILAISHYGEGSPRPVGSVLMVEFEIDGQRFQALNGGPQFVFTEAISLSIACETQAEIDHLWAALSDGGAPSQCGWLKDKFGLSWQIVPTELAELLQPGDPVRSGRVSTALMGMDKLDIAALRRAYEG